MAKLNSLLLNSYAVHFGYFTTQLKKLIWNGQAYLLVSQWFCCSIRLLNIANKNLNGQAYLLASQYFCFLLLRVSDRWVWRLPARTTDPPWTTHSSTSRTSPRSAPGCCSGQSWTPRKICYMVHTIQLVNIWIPHKKNFTFQLSSFFKCLLFRSPLYTC